MTKKTTGGARARHQRERERLGQSVQGDEAEGGVQDEEARARNADSPRAGDPRQRGEREKDRAQVEQPLQDDEPHHADDPVRGKQQREKERAQGEQLGARVLGPSTEEVSDRPIALRVARTEDDLLQVREGAQPCEDRERDDGVYRAEHGGPTKGRFQKPRLRWLGERHVGPRLRTRAAFDWTGAGASRPAQNRLDGARRLPGASTRDSRTPLGT